MTTAQWNDAVDFFEVAAQAIGLLLSIAGIIAAVYVMMS